MTELVLAEGQHSSSPQPGRSGPVKVTIDAGGREVTIECPDTNVTYEQVADKVLELWSRTDGPKAPSEGPAFGLASERKGWQMSPMNMGGGEGYLAEPKAKETGG